MEGLGRWRETSVVFLYGEHDYSTREMLENALAPLTGHIVVDLSWCAFVDSSVIAVMLAKHLALVSEGEHLELIVPPTHVHLNHSIATLGIRTFVDVRDRATAPHPRAICANAVPGGRSSAKDAGPG